MKEISLTKGMVALVDDEDFDYINQWKWYADFRKDRNTLYAARAERDTILGWKRQHKVFMHRVIMDTPEGLVTDHINHNGLDNRKCNMRNVTHSQNGMNRAGAAKNNRLGIRGVERTLNGFRAYIRVQGNRIGFPTRASIDEAVLDRKNAEIKYYGKFRDIA